MKRDKMKKTPVTSIKSASLRCSFVFNIKIRIKYRHEKGLLSLLLIKKCKTKPVQVYFKTSLKEIKITFQNTEASDTDP